MKGLERKDGYEMIEEHLLMCLGEHSMMGSTSWFSENPWVPYAISREGFSIDLVTKERAERNIPREMGGITYRGLPALGVYFGFPIGYVVFCNFSSLNSKTGEIERLEVHNIRDHKTERDIPLKEFKDIRYIGRHADRLKFPICAQVS